MKQPPETLKEPRKHGSMEFPCAFYNSIYTVTSVSHHWHEEMEIVYIEGIGYSVEVDTHDITTKEPAFYFLNQEQLHSLELSANCLEYALVFRPDMLSFSSYDLTQQELLLPFLGQKLLFPSRILLNSPAGLELKNCLLPLLKNAPAPSAVSLLHTKAVLLETIAILSFDELFLFSEPGRGRDSQRIFTIKKLLSYIHDNYTHRIYLHELADLVGMDPQYLCRFFKKSLGKTLTEYINSLRIEKACQSLRDTDNKILDICYDCGFQNMGHFISCFKRLTQKTPSSYRESLKFPEKGTAPYLHSYSQKSK